MTKFRQFEIIMATANAIIIKWVEYLLPGEIMLPCGARNDNLDGGIINRTVHL